jgi:mannosyl-3-phosphoglycerate phosphatase
MGKDWVIFTDLDGTLLDHTTYRWTAARAALRELDRRELPLVLVSSKTRKEILSLLSQLHRREPFVVENGGGIHIPIGYFPFPIKGAVAESGGWWRVSLGTPYPKLVSVLGAAAKRVGVRVRGFARMSVAEVVEWTGLDSAQARRAMSREFDEPFLIMESDASAWPRLSAEIERRGLRPTRGSRFFHIHGANDKGAAVRRLMGWYRLARGVGVRSVGLGDSPNDIPMLRAVDAPILVARPGGRYDRETLDAVPRARRAGGVGPEGWNRAMLRLLA